MRTGFLDLLLLVSSSALAYETTCKSSEIKIKYLGHSKLQFQQKLLDGLDEELRLVAFHQSLGAEGQSVPGDALETFAVSFEGKEKASGKQVRFKVYES